MSAYQGLGQRHDVAAPHQAKGAAVGSDPTGVGRVDDGPPRLSAQGKGDQAR